MPIDTRRGIRLRNAYNKITSYFTGNDASELNVQAQGTSRRNKQYRFEHTRQPGESDGMGFPKSHLSLSSCMHWMFRVNFFVLFVLSCVVFFVVTTFFAGVLYLFGSLEPQCLRVGGEEFQAVDEKCGNGNGDKNFWEMCNGDEIRDAFNQMWQP